MHSGFWWGNLRETVHFADLGIDGTISKRVFKEIGLEGVDWIPLAQDRAEWIAHVNTIITLRMPYNAGNYLASRGTINFSRRVLPHGVQAVTLRSLCCSIERYVM